jgi:HK97 family phage major capsid protein
MTLTSYDRAAARRQAEAALGISRGATRKHAFSFRQFIRDLEGDIGPTGYNREILEDFARATGESDSAGRSIPFALLADPTATPDDLRREYQTRALTAANSGAYLVNDSDIGLGFADRLRHFSPLQEAGVNTVILPKGTGGVGLPVVRSDAGWVWLPDEGSAGTPDQPLIGLAGAGPKTAIGMVKMHRKLLIQGANAEALIRDHLIKGYSALMDNALIAGTGTDGQPLGLLSMSEVIAAPNSALGTNGAEKLIDLENEVFEAGARGYAWTAGPQTGAYLKTLFNVTGNAAIWDGPIEQGQVLGVNAWSTTAAPGNSLVLGPWGDVAVLIWGSLRVEFNPFSDFGGGIVSFRLIVETDLLVPHPAAFAKMTSIT